MSFSIGPIIGKKEVVLRVVKDLKTDSEQWEPIKVCLVSELEKLPAGAPAFVRSAGHHHQGGRHFTIELNPTYPYQTPTLVE